MDLKCMECGNVLLEGVKLKENINCLCDKCIAVWEKSEARMVAKVCGYREDLRVLSKALKEE